MADFDESAIYPKSLCHGTKGGPEFYTTIIEVASGAEIRNQNWTYPRYRYNPITQPLTKADLYELMNFFNARKGMATGFRFKDPYDHTTTDTNQTGGVADPQLIGVTDPATDQYQLIKNYTNGGVTQSRKIVKPIAGTVRIFFDGVEQFGFLVDTTTGVVTLDIPSGPSWDSGGVAITALYDFHVPVRFGKDWLPIEAYDYGVYRVDDMELIELKL